MAIAVTRAIARTSIAHFQKKKAHVEDESHWAISPKLSIRTWPNFNVLGQENYKFDPFRIE